MTRVGNRPFPTKFDGRIITSPSPPVNQTDAAYGTRLQIIGREFGVTTGRPRRSGWLDLVALKYSSQGNSYTQLNMTKLDKDDM